MADNAATAKDLPTVVPEGATGVLVLADGSVIWGLGIGAHGATVGEICFNTSITGYQEILTDPSYAGQIINFTFPHIGNVGTNLEDNESTTPAARGLILRAEITHPSNWRAIKNFDEWLKSRNLIGVAGVDTRSLTRRIRDCGAPIGVICNAMKSDSPEIDAHFSGKFTLNALLNSAKNWPGLEGMDLAKEVTCNQPYNWDETLWSLHDGFNTQNTTTRHVVALDFGAKQNILRCLSSAGCKVTVLPATATAEDVLSYQPNGIFLSNGPGDPAATGEYAVPVIRQLIKFGIPMFGICLGHQLLARALGADTKKMHLGHRGANHPVKDVATGQVEITSQNHGFVVDETTLPDGVETSHTSLFDGSLEAIRCTDGRPIFSV